MCVEAYRSNKGLCSKLKKKTEKQKKQVDVTRKTFAQDPEISHRNFLFSFGEQVTLLKAASAVQQRWLLSLPSGQKNGDFHQLCKRLIFKIIKRAAWCWWWQFKDAGSVTYDWRKMITLCFYSISAFAFRSGEKCQHNVVFLFVFFYTPII